MPYTILYPDSRSDPLDIEREVAGPDVELINARKNKFEEIDAAAHPAPIKAHASGRTGRAQAVSRSGLGRRCHLFPERVTGARLSYKIDQDRPSLRNGTLA